MEFLLLSILCSVLVSVLLKVAKNNNVHLVVAITINYLVCSILSWLIFSPSIHTMGLDWSVVLFVALGVLLPSIFLVMGKAVQHAGLAKADTAQRLALIIPIVASFSIFGEQLTPQKTIALVLIFVAMSCILYKNHQQSPQSHHRHTNLWLLGVFVGYGVIDILLKQLSKFGGATTGNLLISFMLALGFMTMYLLIKKIAINRASVIGGVILGVLNFSNIYTYINAHKAMSDTPTLVFAGMNMGVIILGVLTGLLIFKEKINLINALGIAIGLMGIGVLYLL